MLKIFKKILVTLCVVFSIPTFMVLTYMFIYKYSLLDATMRTIGTPLIFTQWVDDFSEEKYSKIKIGMRKSEVIELLGPPLSDFCDEENCSMRYSDREDGDLDVHFDLRWITLSKKGVVTKVRRSFEFE